MLDGRPGQILRGPSPAVKTRSMETSLLVLHVGEIRFVGSQTEAHDPDANRGGRASVAGGDVQQAISIQIHERGRPLGAEIRLPPLVTESTLDGMHVGNSLSAGETKLASHLRVTCDSLLRYDSLEVNCRAARFARRPIKQKTQKRISTG